MKFLLGVTFFLGFVYLLVLAFVEVEDLKPLACPVFEYTGFQCGGCGSQRAFLHLMNFEWVAAFYQNPILFLFAPYLVLGLFINYYQGAVNFIPEKVIHLLYGGRAAIIVFIVLILWTIVRNL
jgi:hypothetical protein